MPARDASADVDGRVSFVPRDAGPRDGAPRDSGNDAASDAGASSGIAIDGIVGADEWTGATVMTNDTPPNASFAGNSLSRLRVQRDATRLYVAIEAALTAENAILMYVDAALGDASGIMQGTELADTVGSLDLALGQVFFVTDASLRIDYAWGTLDLSRVASAFDERMGWRDVATNTATFRSIDAAAAPSACSAIACETAIRLVDLGTTPEDTVALFVRLGASSGNALSNQTLPMDTDPQNVSAFALVPPP